MFAWLAFDTIRERRQAVQKLLASGLWSAADNAVRELEAQLAELEKQALNQAAGFNWQPAEDAQQSLNNYLTIAGTSQGQLFRLDDQCRIILPRTESNGANLNLRDPASGNGALASCMQRAERVEHAQQSLRQAVSLYRQCTSLARSPEERAVLLQAEGRCLGQLSDPSAIDVFQQLAEGHSLLSDRAGHPYGITAILQMAECYRRQNKPAVASEALVSLYRDIRSGRWLLTPAAYGFFLSNIEDRLDANPEELRAAGILDAYEEIRKSPSPYGKVLDFIQTLEDEIIPRIRERGAQASPVRFLITSATGTFLVSYETADLGRDARSGCAGVCWNLDDLKNHWIAKVEQDRTQAPGIRFRILEGADPAKADALALPFRQFPLPWRVSVTQTGLADLESAGRRENILYSILLSIMLAVMLLGAFLVARDMTREAEANRLKNEFVHNVSHELKTPLSMIRLYSETLQERPQLQEEQRREAYRIITSETERLSHLINNILDFSRIEMGRKEFSLQPGDLAKVATGALDAYRYRLEKKGFHIRQEVSANIPPVRMDAEAVTGAVINLLSNAMKFSRERKEVSVRVYQEEADAVVEIQDQGIGISAQELPRIFDRYYRSPDPPAAETPGSGLGLTLVRYIMDAHSGRIEVESELGRGSTFRLRFPVDSKTD